MAWILPVLTGVADVMSAITFIEFIEEESIQTCMLGAFIALRQRNYTAARQAIDFCESTLLFHLRYINAMVGWMAPYSKGCFYDYCEATAAQIAVYRQLLV